MNGFHLHSAHRFILFGVSHSTAPALQRLPSWAQIVQWLWVCGSGWAFPWGCLGHDVVQGPAAPAPRPLDSRVACGCPAAQPLGCSGVVRHCSRCARCPGRASGAPAAVALPRCSRGAAPPGMAVQHGCPAGAGAGAAGPCLHHRPGQHRGNVHPDQEPRRP